MDRRDLSKILLASASGSALLPVAAQAQSCTPPCFPRNSYEIAAGVTPLSYEFEEGTRDANVFRYMSSAQIADVRSGAKTLDVTAAFASALSANAEVSVPDGTYRTDSSIVVSGGKKVRLSQGAKIIRVSSASATTPVVCILGIGSALEGGSIQSEKASPNGIVVLGHENSASNYNAWWWRFTNCTVKGLNSAGNLSVVVPSGQVTYGVSVANYFGCIQNINIFGADVGLQFMEFANAHNVANIQYWDCRSACLELRGAIENNISGQFMHQGAANGVIGIKISNKVYGSQESSLNTIVGFTVETGGAADQAVVIGANASLNTLIGNTNVAGGFSFGNRDNLVVLSGIVRSCSDMQVENVEVKNKQLISNTVDATRDGFEESNNTIVPISAGGTLTLKSVVHSGLLIIRNATDGGTAVVMCDSVYGATLINGGGFVVVGTVDPGFGSNKLWVTSGTSTTIANRYSTPKHVDVLTLGAS